MFDMLGNIMKNLLSKPATRMYPFEKRENFKNTRGQLGDIDIDACIFCSICAKKCPSDAIIVNRNEKSWEVDRYKCIVCGVCTEVCPKKCLHMEEQYKTASYTKENAKFVQQPKPEAPAGQSQEQKQ